MTSSALHSDAIVLDPIPGHDAIEALGKRLQVYGCAVVQPWDSSIDALLTVAGLLGDVQSHVRANSMGIAEAAASVRQSTNAEWQRHLSEYQGHGTEEAPAHTDGAYLDGVLADGVGVRRVGPPRFIVLQVVSTAAAGGDHFVVDGTTVLNDLLRDEPELAAALMAQGSVSICRDDQLALEKPVFSQLGRGRFSIRFRADGKTHAPDWSLEAVLRLRDHYTKDSRYRSIIDVKDGQVLIVDNTRMLHGRTAFTDAATTGRERLLRRVWIQDPECSVHLHNIAGVTPVSRVLNTYAPYGPVSNAHRRTDTTQLQTGIWLDPEMTARAETLRQEVNKGHHLG